MRPEDQAREPASQALAKGLGASAGADVLRWAMTDKEFAQRVENIAGVQLALGPYSDTSAS